MEAVFDALNIGLGGIGHGQQQKMQLSSEEYGCGGGGGGSNPYGMVMMSQQQQHQQTQQLFQNNYHMQNHIVQQQQPQQQQQQMQQPWLENNNWDPILAPLINSSLMNMNNGMVMSNNNNCAVASTCSTTSSAASCPSMVNNGGSVISSGGYVHLTPQSQQQQQQQSISMLNNNVFSTVASSMPTHQHQQQQIQRPLQPPVSSTIASSSPFAQNQAIPSTTPVKSVPLRTVSKQELQRRKAIEDSRRENEVERQCQRSQPQSNPVDLPILSTSPEVSNIPRKLLVKVQTRLENPTTYHLQQCARNNIARFSAEGINGAGGSVPPTYTSTSPLPPVLGPQSQPQRVRGQMTTGPGSAPPNIFSATPLSPNGHIPSTSGSGVILLNESVVPPSPGPTVSSVATSVTSGCSDILEPYPTLDTDQDVNAYTITELSELCLISQDGSQDIFNYSGPGASLPPKFSAQIGEKGKSPMASSAPLDSPETPDDNSNVRVTKDRQKKDNHNKIERRRRFHINDMITAQGQQLPKPNEPYYDKFGDIKQNKGAILQASVDYIEILKQENETFRQKESQAQMKLKQAELEKKKLLLRIQSLEMQCKRSGISIPEESLTWKSEPERLCSLINGPIQIKEEPRTGHPAFCELMEEDRGDRELVTGACDPMLGQVDPDDIVLASAIDSLDTSDFVMELS